MMASSSPTSRRRQRVVSNHSGRRPVACGSGSGKAGTSCRARTAGRTARAGSSAGNWHPAPQASASVQVSMSMMMPS